MVFLGRQPRVDRLQRKADVEGLCEALRYRDSTPAGDGEAVDVGTTVRRKAIAALREIDDPRATAAAREALDDEDEHVQVEAAALLAERHAPDPLISALIQRRGRLSARVRSALGQALLDAGDPSLTLSFAGRLISEGEDDRPDAEDRRLLERLVADDRGSYRELVAHAAVEDLGDPDQGRRERAIAVLSCLGDAGAQAVREALGGPHRAAAAQALGRVKDSTAVPALLDLLADEQPRVRAAAARALGEIKDPRSVLALLSGMTDESFDVREASSTALDHWGTSALVFALASLAQPLLARLGGGRITELTLGPAPAGDRRLLPETATAAIGPSAGATPSPRPDSEPSTSSAQRYGGSVLRTLRGAARRYANRRGQRGAPR